MVPFVGLIQNKPLGQKVDSRLPSAGVGGRERGGVGGNGGERVRLFFWAFSDEHVPMLTVPLETSGTLGKRSVCHINHISTKLLPKPRLK